MGANQGLPHQKGREEFSPFFDQVSRESLLVYAPSPYRTRSIYVEKREKSQAVEAIIECETGSHACL